MFKRTPAGTSPGKESTVIAKDALVKGSIETKSFIRIDGEVEGEVSTQGDVAISENGKVKLELTARNVTIAGRFEGTLEAEGKVEIKSSGVIAGSIKTNGLVIEEGAIFSGEIEMDSQSKVVKPVLESKAERRAAAKEKQVGS